MDEFRIIYRALQDGRDPNLPAPAYRYSDKLKDESAFLAGAGRNASLEYWKAELAGELPVLCLPLDKPRPSVQTTNGESVAFREKGSPSKWMPALINSYLALWCFTRFRSFSPT